MSKTDATLQAIFAHPTRANIKWRDVMNLFERLGAEISEGSGSRVRVTLNGVRANFHRPHPSNEMHRPLARDVKRFLQNAGVSQ